MPRKRYKAEEIIRSLQQADVWIGEGLTVAQVIKKIGITAKTYYSWRKKYGGMDVTQAQRLKELEKQNSQLKKAVADLTLDKLILKEALEGKCSLRGSGERLLTFVKNSMFPKERPVPS